MTPESNDIEWRRLKSGDLEALESIYRTHVRSMMQYGAKITDDKELVRDTIHDLFLELWKYRANLSDAISPKFYLFGALRNKLMRALSLQSFVSISEMQIAAGELDISSIEIELFRHEEEFRPVETLQQLLQKLSHRQREVISLRFYHNFTYDAIASIMDMNYQSVLNLLQRALKTLRTKYNKLQPPM